tara:strand:+ start:2013 stop:3089 length:1077 start_codon:yes stop_codon:yes gene_type:complete
MDLYGTGASISQANSQTSLARQLNRETTNFNNSIAEQLDEANLEVDEDNSAKLQKNILSIGTAGGKVVSKLDLAKNAKKALGAGKEVATSLGERMAKEVGQERAPAAAADIVDRRTFQAAAEGLEEGADSVGDISRFGVGAESLLRGGQADIDAGLIGVEAPSQVTVDAARADSAAEAAGTELYTAEQTTADVAGASGEAAEGAAEVGGSVAARKTLEEAAEKGGAAALKGAAKTVGKSAVAGIGGAIDVFQDIDRASKGASLADTFGSNNYSRAGNIMNIVGSGLEVAGVLTAWTGPLGLSIEAAGAGLALGGAALETYGDLEDTDETKEKTDDDITSQRRGEVAAAQQETATGRTE